MLDKRTSATLGVVNLLCDEGGYKVLDADDILRGLPKKYGIDAESLRQIIKFLKDREYIDIKYSDENVYCLIPLPKGRLYFESGDRERAENKSKFRQFLWTAFFGALVGGAVGAVIAAVIIEKLLA